MATIMKVRLIVERDPETGRYSSGFPELPVVLQRVTLRMKPLRTPEKRLSFGLNQPRYR